MIINELISNSIEHAFTGKNSGYIHLDVEESDDIIRVTIKDDGSGLPDDVLKGKSKSLGFTIISTLVTQLKADLSLSNENGAMVTFSFTKKEIKGSNSGIIR